MGREVDEHQHELATLQDAHRQKMADMAKRHRDELAEYEERIEELEEQIQSGEDDCLFVCLFCAVSKRKIWWLRLFMLSGTTATLPTTAAASADSSKLEELQVTIQSLREEAELQNTKCSELAASLEEARRQGVELQRETEEAKAENAELLQNYTRLQSSVSELQTRVHEQESKAMVKAQHESEIHALRKALMGEMFCFIMDENLTCTE